MSEPNMSGAKLAAMDPALLYAAVDLRRESVKPKTIWAERCDIRHCRIAARYDFAGVEIVVRSRFKASPGEANRLSIPQENEGLAWPVHAAPKSIVAGCRHRIITINANGLALPEKVVR